MSGKIIIEMHPGTAIETACADAVRVSNLLGVDVEFDFNGVTCLAQPGGDAEELANLWHEQLGRTLANPFDRRFATTRAPRTASAPPNQRSNHDTGR